MNLNYKKKDTTYEKQRKKYIYTRVNKQINENI